MQRWLSDEVGAASPAGCLGNKGGPLGDFSPERVLPCSQPPVYRFCCLLRLRSFNPNRNSEEIFLSALWSSGIRGGRVALLGWLWRPVTFSVFLVLCSGWRHAPSWVVHGGCQGSPQTMLCPARKCCDKRPAEELQLCPASLFFLEDIRYLVQWRLGRGKMSPHLLQFLSESMGIRSAKRVFIKIL